MRPTVLALLVAAAAHASTGPAELVRAQAGLVHTALRPLGFPGLTHPGASGKALAEELGKLALALDGLNNEQATTLARQARELGQRLATLPPPSSGRVDVAAFHQQAETIRASAVRLVGETGPALAPRPAQLAPAAGETLTEAERQRVAAAQTAAKRILGDGVTAPLKPAVDAPTPVTAPVSPLEPARHPDRIVSYQANNRRYRYDGDLTTDQHILKQMGHYKGSIDGKHGPATERAIQDWLKTLNRQTPLQGPLALTESLRSTLRAQAIGRNIDIPNFGVPVRRDGSWDRQAPPRHEPLVRPPEVVGTQPNAVAANHPERRVITNGKATIFNPSLAETPADRRMQGANFVVRDRKGRPVLDEEGNTILADRWNQPLCSAERFMNGQCPAITVAMAGRIRQNTLIELPELASAYREECRRQGGRNCEPVFRVNSTGGGLVAGQVDVAVDSRHTWSNGFARALNRPRGGITLVFPEGMREFCVTETVVNGKKRRRIDQDCSSQQ